MRSDRITSRHWWLAASLVLIATAAGAWMMVPGVAGVYHDDGVYLCTAKALAEGEGYRLINLPGAPLQTKYPPLYPILLAIVWKLFPDFPGNLAIMQWLTLLTGAVAIGAVSLYLVRFGYVRPVIAFSAGLLAATAPAFLYFCTMTMSEAVFLALLTMAMWLLEKELEHPSGSSINEIVLGVALALPFLCRSVGIVVIPLGLYLLFRAKRTIRCTSLAAMALCLPWIAWSAVMPRWGNDLTGIYYTNYLQWWADFSLHSMGKIILVNILYILRGAGTLGQALLEEMSGRFAIYSWVMIAPLGLVALFGAVRHVRSWRVLPCFFSGYLLIILFWPWPSGRFLIPILPFLIAYALDELWLSPPFRVPVRLWKVSLLAGFGVLLTANLVSLALEGDERKNGHYPFPPHRIQSVSWYSYLEIVAWINKNTDPSTVLCSGFDPMLSLYTGRAAIRPYVVRPASLFYFAEGPPLGDPADFMKLTEVYQPRYLVRTAMPGFSEERPLAELIEHIREKCPGWLEPVFAGEDGRFVIYEFHPEALKPVPML